MSKLNNRLVTTFLILAILSLLIVVPFYIQHSIRDLNSKIIYYSMECFGGNYKEVREGVSGCIGSYENYYYRSLFTRDYPKLSPGQ